jgi:hypothetical protein
MQKEAGRVSLCSEPLAVMGPGFRSRGPGMTGEVGGKQLSHTTRNLDQSLVAKALEKKSEQA